MSESKSVVTPKEKEKRSQREARFKAESLKSPPPIPTNRISRFMGRVVKSDQSASLRALKARLDKKGIPLTEDQKRAMRAVGIAIPEETPPPIVWPETTSASARADAPTATPTEAPTEAPTAAAMASAAAARLMSDGPTAPPPAPPPALAEKDMNQQNQLPNQLPPSRHNKKRVPLASFLASPDASVLDMSTTIADDTTTATTTAAAPATQPVAPQPESPAMPTPPPPAESPAPPPPPTPSEASESPIPPPPAESPAPPPPPTPPPESPALPPPPPRRSEFPLPPPPPQTPAVAELGTLQEEVADETVTGETMTEEELFGLNHSLTAMAPPPVRTSALSPTMSPPHVAAPPNTPAAIMGIASAGDGIFDSRISGASNGGATNGGATNAGAIDSPAIRPPPTPGIKHMSLELQRELATPAAPRINAPQLEPAAASADAPAVPSAATETQASLPHTRTPSFPAQFARTRHTPLLPANCPRPLFSRLSPPPCSHHQET